jgi:7,8-dihydro-6-hydroxymethylpterin-pyrophosphokinase
LRFLKSLEHEIGRRPGGPIGGPRPIDLDILLYEERVVESEELTIPHPRMHERTFVLVPLAEVAAEVVHPQRGEGIGKLAESVGSQGVRRVKDAGWDGVAGMETRVRL